jgi:hypothetical protein
MQAFLNGIYTSKLAVLRNAREPHLLGADRAITPQRELLQIYECGYQ